jgi:hypothetical protein
MTNPMVANHKQRAVMINHPVLAGATNCTSLLHPQSLTVNAVHASWHWQRCENTIAFQTA